MKYVVQVPRSLLPPSMIMAQVYGEVRDTGGRPVGASLDIPVHRYPYYLGLRLANKEAPRVGMPLTFEFVAVGPAGKPEPVKSVQLLVKRRAWYSIFRRVGWRQGYESSAYDRTPIP